MIFLLFFLYCFLFLKFFYFKLTLILAISLQLINLYTKFLLFLYKYYRHYRFQIIIALNYINIFYVTYLKKLFFKITPYPLGLLYILFRPGLKYYLPKFKLFINYQHLKTAYLKLLKKTLIFNAYILIIYSVKVFKNYKFRALILINKLFSICLFLFLIFQYCWILLYCYQIYIEICVTYFQSQYIIELYLS